MRGLGDVPRDVFGKTIAAGLAHLGDEEMLDTRDPEETLSLDEPDAYGNPRSAPAKRSIHSKARHLRRSGSPRRDGFHRHPGAVSLGNNF